MQTPPPPATIIRLKRSIRLMIAGFCLALVALTVWGSWQVNMAWRVQFAGWKAWGEFLAPVLPTIAWAAWLYASQGSYRLVITEKDAVVQNDFEWPALSGRFLWLLVGAMVILALYALFSQQGWWPEFLMFPVFEFWLFTKIPRSGLHGYCPFEQTTQVKRWSLRGSKLKLTVPFSPVTDSVSVFRWEPYRWAMVVDTRWFDGGAPRLLEALRQRLPASCFGANLDEWGGDKGPLYRRLRQTASVIAAIGLLLLQVYAYWVYPLVRGQTAWQTRDVAGSVYNHTYLDAAGQAVALGDVRQIYQATPDGIRTWKFRSVGDFHKVGGVVLDRQGRPWLAIRNFSTGPDYLLRWTEDGGERVDYPFSVERFLAVSGKQVWALGRSQAGGDVELLSLDVDSWQVERYPLPQQATEGGSGSGNLLRVVDGIPWLLAADDDVLIWQDGAWQPCGWPQARPAEVWSDIRDYAVTADRQLYVLAESRGTTPYVVGRLAEGEWSWTGIDSVTGETITESDALLVDRRGRLWLGSERVGAPYERVAVTVYEPLPGQTARRLVRYTNTNSNFVESPSYSPLRAGADGYLWATGQGAGATVGRLVSIDANATSLPQPFPNWAIMQLPLWFQAVLVVLTIGLWTSL